MPREGPSRGRPVTDMQGGKEEEYRDWAHSATPRCPWGAGLGGRGNEEEETRRQGLVRAKRSAGKSVEALGVFQRSAVRCPGGHLEGEAVMFQRTCQALALHSISLRVTALSLKLRTTEKWITRQNMTPGSSQLTMKSIY